MSKTLIGIVSFGGLRFLNLLLDAIRDTVTTPNTDVLVIVAKPGDVEMQEALYARGVQFITHDTNKGFPASCNDLYQWAFVDRDYDNLIFCGNDIIPMAGAVDAMIRAADETDWEMICGSEFDSRFLFNTYAEARHHFEGPNMIAKPSAFETRVWDLHKDYHQGLEPDTLKDVRNFTLMKRSAFQKVGYDDVNFWPNGYFADNDTALRCHQAGVRAAGLKEAAFFHWWSRTIHEGEGRPNGRFFERNREHYVRKWGGMPNQETRKAKTIIPSRSHETESIAFWAKQ